MPNFDACNESQQAFQKYQEDVKAGHREGAEYWKGQAEAYGMMCAREGSQPTYKITPKGARMLKELVGDTAAELGLDLTHEAVLHNIGKGRFDARYYIELRDPTIQEILEDLAERGLIERVSKVGG